MTTLYRRFSRWRRLRTYKPCLIPTSTLLLFTSYAVASYERDSAVTKAVTIQQKLEETEIMLAICLNGGSPAYYREGKQIVYIECVKAKERIYL